MEAVGGTIGGLTAHRAQGPGAGGSASAPVDEPCGIPSERDSLGTCLALLRSSATIAAVDAALWNFQDASDFACRVEEISRTAEYLQLVAAHAVERARNEEMSGPSPAAGRSPAAGPGADGCRNAVEYLRATLRISSAEARRRLALADTVLPRTGFAGAQLEPRYEQVGAAISSAEVSSRAGTTITLALEQVRRLTSPARAAEMEQALTRTAVEHDADFLARVTKHWTDAIDQDGAQPSEESLRQLQGAFIRRPRHGLHHLEIFATTDQFENLVTVMNSATNPRTSGDAEGLGPDVGPVDAVPVDAAKAHAVAHAVKEGTATECTAEESTATYPDVSLDHRSRAQKQLDGLVGACKSAMASASLPANGGLRPQVLATIDYRDLLAKVLERQQAVEDVPRGGSRYAGTASLAFTGPVNAATIRKIACDADIIPVVLGSEGRVLDIGRTSRIFPPHIRKAITVRDQGCAFPRCTIPAPWCEAHHIQYWSRGGSTGTGNGVLLCSHHHHLIHKGQWQIEVTAEIPWFIPPPLLDPRQRPQRNLYFRSRPPRE